MNGWERLAAEVAKPQDVHIDGYVGVSSRGFWYGGTAIDGEPMEETAVQMDPVVLHRASEASGEAYGRIADEMAGRVADALVEYWAQIARDRAEMEAEDDGG